MKNSNFESQIRLQKYWEAFSNIEDNEHASISICSKHFGIPINIVRKDIADIVSYSGLSVISINYDLCDEETANLWDDEEKLPALICQGKFDNEPLMLTESNNYTPFCLPLSIDEYQALLCNEHLKFHPSAYQKSPLMIKDSYMFNSHSFSLYETLIEIDSAISFHRPMTFQYKDSKGIRTTETIMPLKLLYDSFENIYAIGTIRDEKIFIYRLDRITNVSDIKYGKSTNTTIDDSAFSIYPQVWGLDFWAEPVNVKVRFSNDGNVFRKVKKDLSYRIKGNIYEKDGFLYYEDTVIGINKFKAWLYGYGSSAVLISPKSVREDIILSIKRASNIIS